MNGCLVKKLVNSVVMLIMILIILLMFRNGRYNWGWVNNWLNRFRFVKMNGLCNDLYFVLFIVINRLISVIVI